MPHETVPADIAAAIEAMEIASEQFGGQLWVRANDGDAVIAARAALDAAILRHLNAQDGKDVTVPWDFRANNCLHQPGFEAKCECIGCPWQPRDIPPADTGGVTNRIAGA